MHKSKEYCFKYHRR